MKWSRPAAVLGAAVLVACGPSPTEPAMDVPVMAEIVADPGDPSTLTYTFNELADGNCVMFGATSGLYEDLAFPDPAPVVPCMTQRGTMGLRPSNFAAAPSEMIVDLPASAMSVSLDVYLSQMSFSGSPTLNAYDGTGALVATDQGGAAGAWTNLTVASSDPAIESIGLVMPEWITDMDDLTVTYVASDPDPAPDPTLDPGTRSDCMDEGWQAFGFRNQGQCIRLIETGQDSR